MKFKTLTLILILLVGLNTNAQNEFNFGAKAGVNYSGFNVDGSSSYSDAFGFHFGVIAEYKLSSRFSLQPELIFIQKTGGRGTPSELPRGLITSDLNYLDLPISGKYYFFEALAVEFGPQLDILISDKTTVDFYDSNPSDNTLDIETNSLQFSLNLGLSYKIVDKYLLQFRYSYGLTDVYQDLEAKN